jgi:hypothetical protein
MSEPQNSETAGVDLTDQSVKDDVDKITEFAKSYNDGNNITLNVSLTDWVIHYESLASSNELAAMLKLDFLKCPRGVASNKIVCQNKFPRVKNYSFIRHDYDKCVMAMKTSNISTEGSSNNHKISNNRNYVFERYNYCNRVASHPTQRPSNKVKTNSGGPQNSSKAKNRQIKSSNVKSKKPKNFPSFYGPNTGSKLILFQGWFEDDEEGDAAI